MKVAKGRIRAVAKAGLFVGPALILEHYISYGRIDSIFGHEWIGLLITGISMVILAFVREKPS